MPFKIALVGDCYGEQEEWAKKPFVGPAGKMLDELLASAGISREACYVTNVFNLWPERNDVQTLCCGKREGAIFPGRNALVKGKFLKAEYAPEITRLYSELAEVKPNITVLLGNTATWALLGQTQVSKLRGAVSLSPYIPGLKLLPTYHPAAVLREYDLRAVTIIDLQKALYEAEFPEVRRITREIWLDPTLDDIREFKRRYLDGNEFAFDIETSNEQITCIGFAPSPDRALVIPFWDVRTPTGSYWPDLATELEAWKLVADILSGPEPKIGQNGLYDIQYLWMQYGIPVNNYAHDTMLLHHALMPESPKGLDFLGSVYCNEAAWKMDRPRGKNTIKRED